MMKLKHSSIIVLLAFSFLHSYAQDAHITLAISRDTVLLGNAFYVQYSFDSKDGQITTPLINPSMIIGQTFKSSTSIINGEVKAIHKQRYLIQPTQEGLFYIPPTSLKSDSQLNNEETPEVTIYVKANPQNIEMDPEDDSSWQFNEVKPVIGSSKRKSKKL